MQDMHYLARKRKSDMCPHILNKIKEDLKNYRKDSSIDLRRN